MTPTVIKCGNCGRPLMEILNRASQREAAKTVWTVVAKCGYPDCLDRSFPVKFEGSISPAGYEQNGRRITDVVGSDMDENRVTFFTRPYRDAGSS